MEVIVLAGGLGTRLRSVVHEIPKSMAPVGGLREPFFPEAGEKADASGKNGSPEGSKPFLGYLLEWLEQYPVSHVVFSVGYLREQVMDYVQSREWPFEYDFAIEETPLGTGGGIRLALSKCRDNEVLVVNGDTFYPVNLSSMPFGAPVTVALKPMQNFDRYGTVSVMPGADRASAGASGIGEIIFRDGTRKTNFPEAITNPTHEDGGANGIGKIIFPDGAGKTNFPEAIANPTHAKALRVTAFHEKQPCRKGLINGGVYAIDRSLLDLSGLPERFSFEKEVLEPGAAKGQVNGWVSDAYFIDIGIPEDYETAQWAIPGWFAVQRASKAVLAADADTLFLDRDGVLNRHLEGDYVKSWEEWEWMPGILEALAKWSRKYSNIVLVTNQRGVGKGVMSDADLGLIHARMLQAIDAAGGRLDLVLVCTAVDDADPRRKPNTGMFQEACALLPGLDPARCIMVGDSPKDALFAARCGMAFVQV